MTVGAGGINAFGPLVDINLITKDMGNLKRFIFNNSVTNYKALSTSILAEMTSLNTAIQASSNSHDLYVDPTIALRKSYTDAE
jgi:hypothetical protein